MIEIEKLNELKLWFRKFTNDLKNCDDNHNKYIDTIYNHSIRVCEVINDIGKHCDLHQNQLRLAEVMALFHDIGKLSQTKINNIYIDYNIDDHAKTSVILLRKHNVLIDIEDASQDLIYTAIENHDKIEIPYTILGDKLFYSKLLRDADKVDVFKTVTQYYLSSEKSIEFGLPDLPEILEKNFLDIESGRLISKNNLKTLNDYKLMQLSWLFDVNFARTFNIIKEGNYIDIIINTLPKIEKISKLKKDLHGYIQKNHIA